MSTPTTLGDLAKFITSKNAGPFLFAVDIVFESREQYENVRDAAFLTPEKIAKLYRREVDDIVAITYFDPAKAIKVTLRRPTPAGSFGDTDVYGTQQHVPLMNYPVPEHALQH